MLVFGIESFQQDTGVSPAANGCLRANYSCVCRGGGGGEGSKTGKEEASRSLPWCQYSGSS